MSNFKYVINVVFGVTLTTFSNNYLTFLTFRTCDTLSACITFLTFST